MSEPASRQLPALVAALLLIFVVGGVTTVVGQDFSAWNDVAANPVFDPGSRAGYPSVIHDPGAFGIPGGPVYRMWYDDGGTAIHVTTSSDGLVWAAPTTCTGLAVPAHPQVLFDTDAFGVSGGPRYKI
jgi:hypothetical protein